MEVSVERCRFALGADQELQQVAAAVGLDWMRLWSLNPGLLHPDYLLLADQLLWVGHLYRAAPGDRPSQLAARMGMDAGLLGRLNRDLAGDAALAGGELLCVVPDSCRGAAHTVYSPQYSQPSTLAGLLADAVRLPGPRAQALVPPP